MSASRYIPSACSRRGLPRRKVSDAQIVQAAQERLTSMEASRRFGVTTATLNHRAARLGVGFQKIERRIWSEQDDQVVRQVAGGRLSLRAGCQKVRVGSAAFKARAKVIDAYIRPDKQRCGTLADGIAIYHEQFEPCLDVGETDRLLEKLCEVHGAPRNEIYPGSDGPVQRLKLEPAW